MDTGSEFTHKSQDRRKVAAVTIAVSHLHLPLTHAPSLSLNEGCCPLEFPFQASESIRNSQKPSERESSKLQIQECSPLSHHVTLAKMSQSSLKPKHFFSGKDKQLGISCCISTSQACVHKAQVMGSRVCLGRPQISLVDKAAPRDFPGVGS